MSTADEAREWLREQGFGVEIATRGSEDDARCWADLVWVANPGFVVRSYANGATAADAIVRARRRYELASASQTAPSARS